MELLAFVFWRSSLSSSSNLVGYAIADSGRKSELLRALLAFALICGVLLASRLSTKVDWRGISNPSFFWPLLLGHVGALLASVALPFAFAHWVGLAPVSPVLVAILRLSLLAIAAICALLCLISFHGLTVLAKAVGWSGAAIAGIVAVAISPVTRLLWSAVQPATEVTFWMVEKLLRVLTPDILVAPEQRVIGTEQFSVTIAPGCSGLEGVVLISLATLAYLWFARKRHRFPNALLILPLAAGAMFLLNSVRIAVLVLIGNAGHPDVAINGFHSQAGWLAFNLVGLGFWMLIQRVRFFAVPSHSGLPLPDSASFATENPAAPYLVPFLFVLAFSFLLRAVAPQDVWPFALEAVLGGALLWIYRLHYAGLRSVSVMPSVCTGVAVFASWTAVGVLTHWQHAGSTPASTGIIRYLWLAISCIGTVAVFPVMQELALRGFLARRIEAQDFETVCYGALGLLAIFISSVVSGALQGHWWLAGTLEAIAYAWLLRRTGQLGSAVLAHAVTNALLLATSLWTGRFLLWM